MPRSLLVFIYGCACSILQLIEARSIDTLKTQNELLRQEKTDTSDKLEQALRELSEMRGELKTLRELPLAATSASLIDIVNLQRIILDNQVIAFKHLGIEGKLKVSSISSKEA